MSLADIFNSPVDIQINGKTYKAEYDFNGYAVLETLTGKGFCKLYDLLMIQNNLTLNESIEIICCSLLKYHSTDEVTKVREYLQTNLHAIQDLNNAVIGVFVAPILPPEITQTLEEIKKKAIEVEQATT